MFKVAWLVHGLDWQKVSCKMLGSWVSTADTIYGLMGYNGIIEEACDLKLGRLGFNPSNVIYKCVTCFKFLHSLSPICVIVYKMKARIHFIELTGLW